MKKYYFYGNSHTPSWYTMTTDNLRQHIDRSQKDGQWTEAFPATFLFTGLCTTAPDKDTAEERFVSGTDLESCKEPACMLTARRSYFESYRKRLTPDNHEHEN